MENIYDNVKVGDIVYAGDKPNRQIFFIHNIVETEPREITSSGFNESGGIVLSQTKMKNVNLWRLREKKDTSLIEITGSLDKILEYAI